MNSINNVKTIRQVGARKARDPRYSTEWNQIEMHRNLQASPDHIPESLMGRTGRTLETQTNGSSHFTNGKTEACSGKKTCPGIHDVCGRAGLESRPPDSQLRAQYLPFPTKEECRGAPGCLGHNSREASHGIYIIKIVTIKS